MRMLFELKKQVAHFCNCIPEMLHFNQALRGGGPDLRVQLAGVAACGGTRFVMGNARKCSVCIAAVSALVHSAGE